MIFSCANLAVPIDIMQHVVRIESSGNPYAIGVVGGKLQRQPKNLPEAVATAKMLEDRGYNFSLGISQVNRYNLAKYGLKSYEHAFQVCPNLQAGSRILKECFDRSRDWGKSFSCYYSGNFVTGFRHGYVQKIFASMGKGAYSVPYPYIYAANVSQPKQVIQIQTARPKIISGVRKNSSNAKKVLNIPPVATIQGERPAPPDSTDMSALRKNNTSGNGTPEKEVPVENNTNPANQPVQNQQPNTGAAQKNTDAAFVF